MIVRTTKPTNSFTLDAETAQTLTALAQQWQLSEEDALRRVIQRACREATAPEIEELSPAEQRQALTELRASLAAQGVDFDAWARAAQAIRRGH